MTPSVQHVTAADGGMFAVTRLNSAPDGTPLILLPGLFTGRRFWLSGNGVGLAAHFAEGGFDCWIVERRGIGHARRKPGAERQGLDEHVTYDLPALQQIVENETGRRAFWIGHSFGGVVAARAAATTLDRSQMAGLVLLASQIEVGLRTLVPPLSHVLTSASRLLGRFPARRLGIGAEDEPPPVIADACRWTTESRRNSAFLETLHTVDVPALGIVGAGDTSDPPDGCRQFFARLSSVDPIFQIAGTDTGFAEDYSHAGIVVAKNARAEIWPLLSDWIAARAESG